MITFFAVGIPAPQGSKKYVGHRKGKPVLVESSKKVTPWRDAVAVQARAAITVPFTAPVRVELAFAMPRPKATPKATPPAIKQPDLDKLVRSTFDALTGIAYGDDSHVTELSATKYIVEPGGITGCIITIREAT